MSMMDLFRLDAETQLKALDAGLLALERDTASASQLEACMRAAHSLKGAARIVGVTVAVRVAGAIEECFVAAQRERIALLHPQIDCLLGAVDLLKQIAGSAESDLGAWEDQRRVDVDACLAKLDGVLNGREIEAPPVAAPAERTVPDGAEERQGSERVLRVTAENLNRLLGLAGESLVESLWVKPFGESLLRLKRLQEDSSKAIRRLREVLPPDATELVQAEVAVVERRLAECQQFLSERLVDIDMFDRRASNLSTRLYGEALACRMRPFADGVQAFPRVVRDLARSLGKQARLEIVGAATHVDRDILQKLDAPLGHLLRNAVDHGLETPAERERLGKPLEGTIRLEARHASGMLQVVVADDGGGVDLAKVREAIVARKLVTPETARALSEAEVLEFLFLPGFTLRETVTDISGRGVGLDVVQDMVRQVRGIVRISSQPGAGTRFQLQLPVTLSVVRTLLTEIAGEPYAFPLTSVDRAVKVPNAKVELAEGRQHFELDGRSIGLVTAHQVLGLAPPPAVGHELSVIVIGDATHLRRRADGRRFAGVDRRHRRSHPLGRQDLR
jgi:two-component system sensor histidine kinase and response regulator WspE